MKKSSFSIFNMRIPLLSKPPGSIPGELNAVSEEQAHPTLTHLIRYDRETIDELDGGIPKDDLDTSKVHWLDVVGLGDIKTFEALGDRFGIDNLLLEDALNTLQRPKMEQIDDIHFFTLKMMSLDKDQYHLSREHVTFLLGKSFMVSIQERPGDLFDPVRNRLRNNLGQVRKRGADYLFFLLIDTIVDHYYLILNEIGERLATLEDKIAENPEEQDIRTIVHYKKMTMYILKNVVAVRDGLLQVLQTEQSLFHLDTRKYFRDVHDHSQQIFETTEIYRGVLNDLMDLYHSGVSNRMNKIMQFLTIISTIFIPLTFLAGIYGMNFENMPELKYRWGYPGLMALMLVIALLMFNWYRRKKWL